MIATTIYSDPACPWAYSESPALRVIEWRYGDQLRWRLVLIGLTEDASQYAARGYTPLRGALGQLRFRRYGMPFSPAPKARLSATARGCRAVAAARLQAPGSEWAAFRAIQLANFTTPLVLEDDAELAVVLDRVPGIDGPGLIARLDDPDVTEAYERDRAEARTAAGSPAELQRKTASTDGPVRFTAPSVVFEANGHRLIAGGFQPVEAYDVLIANFPAEHRPDRREPPESPLELIEFFRSPLTTQEIAAVMAHGNDAPDRAGAEDALIALAAAGEVQRIGLGD
ncbi:MAG: DsbA family protein, partial [Solirubrobacterales bacterium]|nr:DsbA family protein [Solirubrobacterales bacterium]